MPIHGKGSPLALSPCGMNPSSVLPARPCCSWTASPGASTGVGCAFPRAPGSLTPVPSSVLPTPCCPRSPLPLLLCDPAFLPGCVLWCMSWAAWWAWRERQGPAGTLRSLLALFAPLPPVPPRTSVHQRTPTEDASCSPSSRVGASEPCTSASPKAFFPKALPVENSPPLSPFPRCCPGARRLLSSGH